MAAAVATAMVEALVGGPIAAVVMGKTCAECDAAAGKYDTGAVVVTNALLPASIIPPTPIKVGETAVGIAIRPALLALPNLLLLTASTAAAAACCDFFLVDGTL